MVKRLLVLRWGAVGDFLLTLPAIYSLRRHYCNAHIAVMADAHAVSLASSIEYADEFLEFDYAITSDERKARESARLSMLHTFEKFDFIVNFHSFSLLDELLEESGARYTSFCGEVFQEKSKHASRHYRDFIESMLIPPVYSRPKVYLSRGERLFALKYLSDRGLNWRRDCIVALHAGSGDPRKRWFPDRFREVSRRLLEIGAKVMLLSGPFDTEVVNFVRKGLEREGAFIVCDLPIRKVAALMERAMLYVGNDSGLMHLASAVDTPVVSIFGPSSPLVWGPTGPWNTVLVGKCSREEWTLEECKACKFQECLDSVRVEDVTGAALNKLRQLARSSSVQCPGHYFPA